jgi:hypothetical protein
MNPFYVKSPEGLSAADACSLFVDSFSDYPMLLEAAHMFIVGPRGTGKSMMFRYMMPDCQMLDKRCSLQELPFFSVYVPLKRQNFNLAELGRLDNVHASYLINEHLLTTHVARRVLEQITHFLKDIEYDTEVTIKVFRKCLDLVGSNLEIVDKDGKLLFDKLIKCWSNLFDEAVGYLQSIAFSGPLPYERKLVSYLEHLLPTLNAVSGLEFMSNGPIFLLMDDAHNLSHTQTQILNGWVYSRTTSSVAIKISTQPNYKTYFTPNGDRIETPHDFSETRTAEIYTTKFKGRYFSRISNIVARRLEKAGLNVAPSDFFPPDKDQEDAISRIAEELRAKHANGEGRGARASDDAIRYARPNYIRDLAGVKKSSSKYSYAGFDQLVHVSSGITRHFLDCASRMYDRVVAQKQTEGEIEFIPPGIQDEVLRDEADELRFRFFSREMDDEDPHSLKECKASSL